MKHALVMMVEPQIIARVRNLYTVNVQSTVMRYNMCMIFNSYNYIYNIMYCSLQAPYIDLCIQHACIYNAERKVAIGMDPLVNCRYWIELHYF